MSEGLSRRRETAASSPTRTTIRLITRPNNSLEGFEVSLTLTHLCIEVGDLLIGFLQLALHVEPRGHHTRQLADLLLCGDELLFQRLRLRAEGGSRRQRAYLLNKKCTCRVNTGCFDRANLLNNAPVASIQGASIELSVTKAHRVGGRSGGSPILSPPPHSALSELPRPHMLVTWRAHLVFYAPQVPPAGGRWHVPRSPWR